MLPAPASFPPPLDDDWLALKDVVKRFEHAWREALRPAIDDYLPASGPLRSRLLIELVHIDMELRLKAGEAARVEEYQSRYPELTGDRTITLDLIAAEHELRRRREPSLALEEYLQRFPQYRAELTEQIPRPTVAAGATTPRPADTHTESPPEVPGYEILGLLGRGGMGVVYKAQDLQLNRPVALKTLTGGSQAAPAERERFHREAQSIAHLDHPGIVPVYEVGNAGGLPYFSMKYFAGGSLAQRGNSPVADYRAAARLVESTARAIHHAHQRGILHRDLRPSNILLDEQNQPHVSDFGLAKRFDLATGPGDASAIAGTPGYMAPEQAAGRGDLTTSTDVYGLGAILYELLAGGPPFAGDSPLDVMRRLMEQAPPRLTARNSRVPRELETIAFKCLEKDPRRRYETAQELAEDLNRWQNGLPIVARPTNAVYRFRKFVRRNRGLVVATAALALSLIAGVAAVVAVQIKANRDRATEAVTQAAHESWTNASIVAAVREARERANEAWNLADFPDRLQLATSAAVAAISRADEFAAGGVPTETTVAELAAARLVVENLERHARLITAEDGVRKKFADSTGAHVIKAMSDAGIRRHEALRQYGLDPINDPLDEIARAIAASRIRDTILGMLSEWHHHATVQMEVRRKYPDRIDVPAAPPGVRDRLWQVIRAARQHCGGAYARWQDLLDRNDVSGLVDFANSPDGLSFRANLVGALGRDLFRAKQYKASQAFLRSAVDRYPHEIWLHYDLTLVCGTMKPPEHTEALRHMAAVCVLRPDSPLFHALLGEEYEALNSYDQAVTAYRKAISLAPGWYFGHRSLGGVLLTMKDGDGAVAAFRESMRLQPNEAATHVYLGNALNSTGQHAEALKVFLAALRQNPAWAEDSRKNLRYSAACAAMRCANGKGVKAAPPERSSYRKQALEFLTAELAAIRKLAEADRPFVHRAMVNWLDNNDLASVRDPMAVELLPPDERTAWQKLWVDVRDVRDHTAGPASP
jgi:tetratricopeptide (TPR) repeat protein